jgi:hypothetical protein
MINQVIRLQGVIFNLGDMLEINNFKQLDNGELHPGQEVAVKVNHKWLNGQLYEINNSNAVVWVGDRNAS